MVFRSLFFKKCFSSEEKSKTSPGFIPELNITDIAHYIYYLATDNIRIITDDDTVCY
ncbi:DUF1398 family protein [Escherichia coli]